MYSYIKDNQKGEKTAKGIKKNIIKNDIKHINYKETLFNKEQMYHKMKQSEVKTINSEVMKSIKYHSAALMIKDIY